MRTVTVRSKTLLRNFKCGWLASVFRRVIKFPYLMNSKCVSLHNDALWGVYIPLDVNFDILQHHVVVNESPIEVVSNLKLPK